MNFDNPLVRFGTAGTLIAIYSAVHFLARRSGGEPVRAAVHPPRWLGLLILVSILAFYATVRPFGGAWLGGGGNAIGIALALTAAGLRWATRRGTASVRQPDVAARVMFYVALPLAVGDAWGWITLTLPAIVASAACCRREDRLLSERHGEAWRARVAATAHWLPRVW